LKVIAFDAAIVRRLVLSDKGDLPRDLLSAASIRGRERAWRVELIPAVIEAARRSGLFSSGGQLQFRADAIYECYWVAIDGHKGVAGLKTWHALVTRSAKGTLAEFLELRERFNFTREGWEAFPELRRQAADENALSDLMWFTMDTLNEVQYKALAS